MAGDKLLLDTPFLTGLGNDLHTVAVEFEHANAHSDDVAGQVGHDGLADHVREFAHNWDDRRKKMMENLGKLAESATKVGESFTEVDSKLADVLTGEK